ncbi:hypothetical protein NPX13_g1159 [Xylaria arbuscula]|uniref:Uncharacterized protein n=1 Tax=Xylaria arbuscula TaxID=114810 RepID=A0A9W8NLK1_9PEZI|nr:hypothetical protein NPX13_g1159 [Xylaria arbuscula]
MVSYAALSPVQVHQVSKDIEQIREPRRSTTEKCGNHQVRTLMLLVVTVGVDTMQSWVACGVEELTTAIAPTFVVFDVATDALVTFVETISPAVGDFGIKPVEGRGLGKGRQRNGQRREKSDGEECKLHFEMSRK